MTDKHDAGKGDRYRRVDQKKFGENWDQTFGKKKNSKNNIMQSDGIYDIPQPEDEDNGKEEK